MADKVVVIPYELVRVGEMRLWKGEDSEFRGVVVAVFVKRNNRTWRCVAEDERRLLLIKSADRKESTLVGLAGTDES